MSRNFANFAQSQECDLSKINFFGSVSPMLEIENVGNFLLTQAEQNGSHAICVGCFPASFRQLVSYNHLSKVAVDSVHASIVENGQVGLT